MEHAKLTKYSYFYHKLRKKFDMRQREICHKDTFPKETKEDAILITLDRESLHSPPAAEVLVFGGETLSPFKDSLKTLTHRVPCMIHEMHEEEEVDSSTGTLIEEQPSLLPIVEENIVPVGGTLVVLQEVPTHQLIQGKHTISSHIFSVPLIETYGDMT